MSKIGTVQKSFNGLAIVFVPKDKTCENCPSCAGCNAKGINMTVGNQLDAKEGDLVEISTSEKSNLPLAALVFIVPVLLPILLYSLLSGISETVAIGAVAGSLILWMTAVFLVNRKLKKDPSRTGQIVGILSKEDNLR